MRVESLFEMVGLLLERGRMTADELAGHFGVSCRTVYRWMEALSVAGVPVYAVQGRGGGIRIAEGYAPVWAALTEGEKREIASAVRALASLTGGGVSSARLPFLAGGGGNWLEVDFAPWNPKGAEVRGLFGTFRDAILARRQAAFDYVSIGGVRGRRTVQPWKVVFRGQAWYLFGWCNGRREPRYFKLSRMRNARVLAAAADVLPEDVPPERMPPPSGGVPVPADVRLAVRVRPGLAHRFLDEYAADSVEDCPGGGMVIRLTVPDFPWLAPWLLGLGPGAEVLEPERMRRRVAELARKVTALYGGTA